MLYFIENTFGQLIAVTGDHDVNTSATKDGARKLCRWDFRSLVDAEVMAGKANNLRRDQNPHALNFAYYIAVDAGEYNSPRYDVIRAPQLGDQVSRYFNGDAYPAGTITKISKTLFKITTDTGLTFYRVKQSGTWLNEGTWSMVSGHRSEQNPSF